MSDPITRDGVRYLDVEIVPGVPDLEDAARLRQVIVDQHRAVADTLAEVGQLLGDEVTARVLTARADDILARVSGETRRILQPLVRAMKTGDVAKIERAMAAAARKLGLRRGQAAGEIVDFDRSAHAAIAGERIATGAKVRIVRPGYDATIDGEDLRLAKATVEPLTEAEVREIERRALRATARERNRQLEQASGTARLLAEIDELLAKNAGARVIAERLDDALLAPEALFSGADPLVMDALRTALGDGSDLTKIRSAVTRLSTKAKIKPISRSGAKTKFNPETMETLPGAPEIKAGAPVTVVTRGSTTTLPDGSVVQLRKAVVTPVT
jgi:hypothetical protein